MEDLDFDVSDSEDVEGDDSDSELEGLDEDELAELSRIFGPARGNYVKANTATSTNAEMEEDMNEVWGRGKKKLGVRELEGLLRDADGLKEEGRPRKKGRRVELDAEGTSEKFYKGLAANGVSSRSAKRTPTQTKTKKVKVTAKPAFDLVEPEFFPTMRPGMRTSGDDNDGMEAYGEATALSMADDADKKARKRTLRFHTSRIETSARRREEGRERLGGGWSSFILGVGLLTHCCRRRRHSVPGAQEGEGGACKERGGEDARRGRG
jgi:U3 small nucleolar RNA-associated protein 3